MWCGSAVSGARHNYQQVIDSGYPEFARRAAANLSAL